MDQLRRSARLGANDLLDRIVSALGGGVILVNADGHVVWVDETTRRRINGGLQNLVLPLNRAETDAIDCFISTVEITNSSKRSVLCVIQESNQEKKTESDVITAIHAVMT